MILCEGFFFILAINLGKLDFSVDAIAKRRHYDFVILTGDEIPRTLRV